MPFTLVDNRAVSLAIDLVRLGYNNEGPVVAGVNEVQTVTISGAPTGGTFTLTYDGRTTAAIAYNAAAATVLAALEALENIYVGDVAVTGAAGGPYTVTFQGRFAQTNVPQMTAAHTFTGGTTPSIAVATTTEGVAASPAIEYIDVDSNDVAFDPQFSTLTTQGTTQLHEKQRLNAFRVNISNQVLQFALAKVMLGDPTTTGIAGVAQRYGYDGSFRSRDYVLELTYKGTDLSNGSDVTVRQTFHKMQPSAYLPFGGAPAQAVPTNTTTLVAKKAKTNLLGTAIPGLKNTQTGDLFSLDLMATA